MPRCHDTSARCSLGLSSRLRAFAQSRKPAALHKADSPRHSIFESPRRPRRNTFRRNERCGFSTFRPRCCVPLTKLSKEPSSCPARERRLAQTISGPLPISCSSRRSMYFRKSTSQRRRNHLPIYILADEDRDGRNKHRVAALPPKKPKLFRADSQGAVVGPKPTACLFSRQNHRTGETTNMLPCRSFHPTRT
jgi:hypothetical protein